MQKMSFRIDENTIKEITMTNTKTKLTLDSQVLNHLFVGVDFNNKSEVEDRLREITLRVSLSN